MKDKEKKEYKIKPQHIELMRQYVEKNNKEKKKEDGNTTN